MLIPVVADPISTVSSRTRFPPGFDMVPVTVKAPAISVLSDRVITPLPESMTTLPVVDAPRV